MYITREFLQVFYQQVIQNVAKRLEIKDYEWKSATELVDEIQTSNPKVVGKINAFIEAYETWYKVHKEIDESGTAGNLTVDQNENLMKAIGTRDSTKKDLVDAINL